MAQPSLLQPTRRSRVGVLDQQDWQATGTAQIPFRLDPLDEIDQTTWWLPLTCEVFPNFGGLLRYPSDSVNPLDSLSYAPLPLAETEQMFYNTSMNHNHLPNRRGDPRGRPPRGRPPSLKGAHP